MSGLLVFIVALVLPTGVFQVARALRMGAARGTSHRFWARTVEVATRPAILAYYAALIPYAGSTGSWVMAGLASFGLAFELVVVLVLDDRNEDDWWKGLGPRLKRGLASLAAGLRPRARVHA